MIRGKNHYTTARMAICAALLCGSNAAFAQEAAVAPTVQAAPPPAAAAPVVPSPTPIVETTTVVAPPPVVATIPAEQLVKPAANSARPAARAAAARPAVRSEIAQPARVTQEPTATAIDPTANMTPSAETNLPANSTVEDTAAIAPVAQDEVTAPVDANDDNMIVVGGVAAALGLAGLGALLARRRRRPVEQHVPADRTETVVPIAPSLPAYAPAPVAAAAPIFTAPMVAAESDSVRPAAIERATPRYMPSVEDRNLPPVTDPLFAHQVELGPITDPLFSHKAELAPVTDPMFADRDDFMDNGSPSSAFDKRRSWPNTPDNNRPVRELEPAE